MEVPDKLKEEMWYRLNYGLPVSGILVPKILVRGPKFSAIFPENLGPTIYV